MKIKSPAVHAVHAEVELSMSTSQERLARAKDEMHEVDLGSNLGSTCYRIIYPFNVHDIS